MLTLPWPPAGLSPNQRLHWAKKSKIAKAYRRQCHLLCRQAGLRASSNRVRLVLEFVPPDRRKRDDDNLVAAFKSGRDGLADALGIDDNRFITSFSLSSDCMPGGAVLVRIEEVSDVDA